MIDEVLELIKRYPKTIVAANDDTYSFFNTVQKKQQPPPTNEQKKRPIDLTLTKTAEKKLDPSFGNFVKKSLPNLETVDAVPSDSNAKKIKEAWKTRSLVSDCLILVSSEQDIPLLTNLARAIDTRMAPCRLLKTTLSDWEAVLSSQNLKLIIAPESTIFEHKQLLSHMRENPGEAKRYLGNIPLLLLPDLAVYKKDSQNKRHLWNLICQSL